MGIVLPYRKYTVRICMSLQKSNSEHKRLGTGLSTSLAALKAALVVYFNRDKEEQAWVGQQEQCKDGWQNNWLFYRVFCHHQDPMRPVHSQRWPVFVVVAVMSFMWKARTLGKQLCDRSQHLRSSASSINIWPLEMALGSNNSQFRAANSVVSP